MAFSPLSLFLLITLLFHIAHARDTQLFNKVPSTNNINNDLLNDQQQQPSFLPESEHAYGLYGHESGLIPPSTLNKAESKQHLPRQHDSVTELEDEINAKTKFPGETINSNRNSNGEEDYYDSQQEEKDPEYRSRPFTGSLNNQPQALRDTGFSGSVGREHYFNHDGYGNGVNRQGMSDARSGFSGSVGQEHYFNHGGIANGVKRQGMSDTRFLENGKYFYDVNAERYSSDHPYERIRARSENVNRNFYGNTENVYQYIDDITRN